MSVVRVNQIQDTSTNVAANISGGVVTFTNPPVGAGKVLQVKQLLVDKSTITTSSATFVSTGKSFSITPSATSSKIMVEIRGGEAHCPYVSQFMVSTIFRGSINAPYPGSNVLGIQTIGNSSSGLSVSTHNICFLDSPNTTNEVTYTPHFRSQPTKPDCYFNLAGSDGSAFTITLTEIGG